MSTPTHVRWGGVAVAFSVSFALMAAGRWLASAFPDSWLANGAAQLLWLALLAAMQALVMDYLLRRSIRRLRAVNDLARELSQPHRVPTLLDMGLRTAARLMGARTAALRLRDGDGRLVLSAVHNLPADYAQEFGVVSTPSSALRLPLHAAEPTVLGPEKMPAEISAMIDGGVGTAIVGPVVSHGSVHGVLILAYPSRHPATRNDLETLRAIGTQIGTALLNRDLQDRLLLESQTDALTGLASRRHFEDLFQHEVARARRNLLPLTLAMIDVDRFKEINDQHGHVVGDKVLSVIAHAMVDVRGGDVVARYGGDEFVILMPETKRDAAEQVMARLRARIEHLNTSNIFPFPISLSIGVAELGAPGIDLVAAADRAMYEDKERRRQSPWRQPVGIGGRQSA